MTRLRLSRVVRFVTDHNVATLVVMVLLTGAVVAGIPQLDTENQASPDAASFQGLDRVEAADHVEAHYGRGDAQDTTLAKVYVHSETANVLSKDSLLAGLRYQRAVRDDPAFRAARDGPGLLGLSNLVATRAAEGDDPALGAQIDALEATSPDRVASLVAATLAEDPRAGRFLPADHDPSSRTAHDRRLVATLDASVDESTLDDATAALHEAAERRSGAGFFTLGSHARGEFTTHLLGQTVELVVPVALVSILFVLAFAYRDLVDVVVGMVGVGLAILWMFGIMGWLGVAAGVVSIVPVVLLTGLSVDFSFHVFNRYREERGPADPIRAPMRRGVRRVGTALVLVTVTAAIGFLANLANPMALIRSLGVSITLGVVSALVLFTTVVPALKVTVDRLLERVGLDRRQRPLGRGTHLAPVLRGGARLARRSAPLVLVVALLGAAVSGAAWTGLDQEQFTGRQGEVAEWKQDLPAPLGWEPHAYQARDAHVDATYTPVGAADAARSSILVEGAVTAPGTLADVRTGVERLRDAGVLLEGGRSDPVRSPVTAMQAVAARDPGFRETFRAADTDGDGVPDRDLEAVYDALYAADADLAGQVVERTDGDYRSLLVTVTLDGGDQRQRQEYVAALEDGAAAMGADGDRAATVAGSFAVTESVLDAIRSGILLTMAVALAAIVAALAAVFRLMHGSATLGAVVAVPILFVVGFVVGGMYALSIPLNLLTALLMSLVIGVGVDYNIHLGDRFADELRAGRDPVPALRRSLTGTGGALLGSTLTSVGAFSTLLLVPDPGLQAFGGIVVLALGLALLTSVYVLPSALVLWCRYVGGVGTVTGEPGPDVGQGGVVGQD